MFAGQPLGATQLLLQYGAPVTLSSINRACQFVDVGALEVLLRTAAAPAVPQGSEGEPVDLGWGIAIERLCPLSTMFHAASLFHRTWPRREVARVAEQLLAAGYRPTRYRHALIREAAGPEVHLRDFCPVSRAGDGAALLERLPSAYRWAGAW